MCDHNGFAEAATPAIIVEHSQIQGARARLFAALTGLLLVLAQLTALSDLLLVRHAVCAEHGDIVHVEATRQVEASVVGASRAGPNIKASPAPAETDHQHGCEALVHLESAWAVVAEDAALVAARLVVVQPQQQIIAVLGVRALSVLEYAPKNSPPATERS